MQPSVSEAPEPLSDTFQNVLFGLVCLDIYTRTGDIRPGCGLLHNAYHLQQLAAAPLLLTRLGQEQRDIFHQFFRRNQLTTLTDSLVAPGHSATIDIDIQPSGEAVITNFRLGVWSDFRLVPTEAEQLAQAKNIHTVLVEGFLTEFQRLNRQGQFKQAFVSADFLSFRNFSPATFAEILPYINLGFIGWKGELTDPTVRAIREVVQAHRCLLLLTLGERGIQVFDSRQPGDFRSPFFAVQPVPVQGNTNGCGDAFISYFLAEYWRSQDLEKAIEQGKIGGARATAWNYALPDEAYQT